MCFDEVRFSIYLMLSSSTLLNAYPHCLKKTGILPILSPFSYPLGWEKLLLVRKPRRGMVLHLILDRHQGDEYKIELCKNNTNEKPQVPYRSVDKINCIFIFR